MYIDSEEQINGLDPDSLTVWWRIRAGSTVVCAVLFGLWDLREVVDGVAGIPDLVDAAITVPNLSLNTPKSRKLVWDTQYLGEWKATYGGTVCCVSAREIKALVVVWPSHIVSITLEVSFKKSCNVLKMMRLTEYENRWLGSLELHVQICIFVPSALLPPVTSKHLLPKTVTAPPVKVHFWASEPMQVWIVTAAPSVFDAAVRHLAVYTCTQYNCGDCF